MKRARRFLRVFKCAFRSHPPRIKAEFQYGPGTYGQDVSMDAELDRRTANGQHRPPAHCAPFVHRARRLLPCAQPASRCGGAIDSIADAPLLSMVAIARSLVSSAICHRFVVRVLDKLCEDLLQTRTLDQPCAAAASAWQTAR